MTKFEAERGCPALVWKKGRNAHARALLAGLRRGGRLPAPFDAGPPASEPLGAALPVACAVSVGLSASGEWVAGRRRRRARRIEGGGGGGAFFAEQRQQVTRMAGDSGSERSGSKGRTRRPVLAGTALPLAPPLLSEATATGSSESRGREEGEGEEAGAAAAAGDDSSSSAAAHLRLLLPSRVELAASLGAAAERIAELEWRLGEKERRARAREWEASVAAARAATALLSTSTASEAEEEVKEEEKKKKKERRRAKMSPSPRHRRMMTPGAAPVGEKTNNNKRAVPFLARSPRAEATVAAAAATSTTPLLRTRPKVAASPQREPPTSKRKLKLPETATHQEQKVPTVSLEEISRRIAALAPQ